ncbi:hypothetical protein ACLXNF_24080 [Mycobacteroides chelonae]|uniref:hypothetical protein n=1 Tax=Mycobacteroides chelonae TaxID=1774 RepID=UPI0039ECFDE9
MDVLALVANGIQLVGTIITAWGLAIAYGRAKKIPDQIRAWWHRKRSHPGRGHEIFVPGIDRTGGVGIPDTLGGFQLDRDKEVPDQLIQLEAYAHRLASSLRSIHLTVVQHGEDIEKVEKNSESRVRQALSEAKAEIKQFGDHLDELQAVDLKVAILGVAITVIGIGLAIVDLLC